MIPRDCTDRARFMAKVEIDENSGCWRWTGYLDRNGYGSIRVGGRSLRAHRFAWLLFRASDASELLVLHTCDVPACVNPSHLFLGTAKDNQTDKAIKCRGKTSRSGLPYGVTFSKRHRSKPFRAAIGRSGVRYHLGMFATAGEAAAVAMAFKRELYSGAAEEGK